MKNQALFFSKDKSKKLKCRLLQFLLDAVRVNGVLCIQSSFEETSSNWSAPKSS